MPIDMGRSEPGGYTIAESIAELMHELGAETLARLRDERALLRGDTLIAQPDFALWWHCSRFGAEPMSRHFAPRLRSARASARHPRWRRRCSPI
jgi:hypothetical protein